MAPELALAAVLLAAGLGLAQQQSAETDAVHWTPVATTAPKRTTTIPTDNPQQRSFDELPPDITQTAGEEYQSRVVPPTIQELAQTVQTDAQLQERIRQEQRDRGLVESPIEFPPDPILSRDRYMGRNWPHLKMEVAPYYVAHGRLLFQQINAERYGWDLGFVHPVIAATGFFWDFVTAPYHLGTALCRPYDANLGWCLPGDPVPLMLYPPEISLTGTITETATILALVAIFP
jgi:hypothetical protein